MAQIAKLPVELVGHSVLPPLAMGNLRAFLSVALPAVAVAACGGNDAKPDAQIVIMADAAIDVPAIDAPPDAPSYDFSCSTLPAPTTATANVVLSGGGQEVVINGGTPSIQAAVGVTVKVCKGDCTAANLLDTKTTAAGGTYTTASLATGGVPLDAYLDGTKTGNHRTLVFPPSPVIADTPNVPVLMFSNAAFGLIGQVAGTQPIATKGSFALAIVDCANTPVVVPLTLSIKQGGTAVAGSTTFDLGALAAQAAGTYLVLNVPPGDTEVNATVNGQTFRAHVIKSIADATTETIIRPGF